MEQDFEQMHPKSTMKLYAEWSILAAFIEKKLTNKKDIEYINDSLNPGKLHKIYINEVNIYIFVFYKLKVKYINILNLPIKFQRKEFIMIVYLYYIFIYASIFIICVTYLLLVIN